MFATMISGLECWLEDVVVIILERSRLMLEARTLCLGLDIWD